MLPRDRECVFVGLKKLPLQTIINAVMVLTFLAVGYATEEYVAFPIPSPLQFLYLQVFSSIV